MMHRLLNSYEKVTYRRVKEVADQHGAQVCIKVRLADVIPVNNSGVSDADFSFALKAHLDFLVTDGDYSPLFAVEFDGPNHKADTQKRRDQQKDGLAARFDLPLLRINANYLNRKYRYLDLLTYFVEVWFLHQGFLKGQEAGHIPGGEPFDPSSVESALGRLATEMLPVTGSASGPSENGADSMRMAVSLATLRVTGLVSTTLNAIVV